MIKLNGIGVTLPVCDLRFFVDPSLRLEFVSPLRAEPGKSFIRGFGICKLRKKPRIPWREAELVYFECSRAIQLPSRLPDGAPVTRTVKRAYVDDYSLVRIELTAFTHPNKAYESEGSSLERFARDFWAGEAILTSPGAPVTRPLWSLLDDLVRRFEAATSVHPAGSRLCRPLEPQLLVLAEVPLNDMPRNAEPIDTEAKLWLGYETLTLSGVATTVDAMYLIHVPGFFRRPLGAEFEQHRQVRAHIGSLHADLQMVSRILSCIQAGEVEVAAVSNYLLELCRGLRAAPIGSDVNYQIIAQLTTMFEKFHGNQMSRILTNIQRSDRLPDLVKNKLNALFLPYVRDVPPEAVQMPLHTRDSRVNEVNARLHEALKLFSEHTIDSSATVTRYDDTKFQASACRKAEGVIRRLPANLAQDRLVFVSVGGADGTELLELLRRTGSRAGVLLEKSRESCRTAENAAAARRVKVEVVPGDIMQELNTAMTLAGRLKQETGAAAVVVTAQAVLHELPTRAMGFNLFHYLAGVRNADVVIGREPAEPYNWSEIVRIYGDFDGGLFLKLARLIRMHHPDRFSDDLYKPEQLNDGLVRAHRALVMETLTKAFYSEDFLYELQECVTSFTKVDFERELGDCLGLTHSWRMEPLTSESVHRFWNRYKFHVKSEMGHGLGEPWSHLWYHAIRTNIE